MPPKQGRAMATGNMHKNLVSMAAWFSSYASGQTDRHTEKLITILGNPTRVK